MKQLVVVIAFAVLVASPALARSHQSRAARNVAAPAASSTDVIVNGAVVGRDPDAAIRTQLFRGSPYGPT